MKTIKSWQDLNHNNTNVLLISKINCVHIHNIYIIFYTKTSSHDGIIPFLLFQFSRSHIKRYTTNDYWLLYAKTTATGNLYTNSPINYPSVFGREKKIQ